MVSPSGAPRDFLSYAKPASISLDLTRTWLTARSCGRGRLHLALTCRKPPAKPQRLKSAKRFSIAPKNFYEKQSIKIDTHGYHTQTSSPTRGLRRDQLRDSP